MKSAHKSESAPCVSIASSAQSLQEGHKEPKGRLPRLRAGSDAYTNLAPIALLTAKDFYLQASNCLSVMAGQLYE
jgi:hypothetical protein